MQKVLILGQGAREHALAWRLSKSASHEVFVTVAPGNAGIAREFTCAAVNLSDIPAVVARAQEITPDLVVVGPEDPLALGVVDALQAAGFLVFGPTQFCAQAESSKSFMKRLCEEAHIQTAQHVTVDDEQSLIAYLQNRPGQFVVKADGLCAGKGVQVCADWRDAINFGQSLMKRFSTASHKIVVEEFLLGVEASVIAICDGDDAHLFAPVRDHKRLLDGNFGPNTGGMGVVGPLGDEHGVWPGFIDEVKERVFMPALRWFKQQGQPYRGFLYAGLMLQERQFWLLEFNARLGDPEAQALMFGTDVDLYKMLVDAARGSLKPDVLLHESMQPTAVVVLASEGYPDAPVSGHAIEGVDTDFAENQKLFFAGVGAATQSELVTNGGRILSATAKHETLEFAIKDCYGALANIVVVGAHKRSDIGVFS